jgi:hypothetical protein
MHESVPDRPLLTRQSTWQIVREDLARGGLAGRTAWGRIAFAVAFIAGLLLAHFYGGVNIGYFILWSLVAGISTLVLVTFVVYIYERRLIRYKLKCSLG